MTFLINSPKMAPTKAQLLDDLKIRNSFSLGNAIRSLRKTKPGLKVGFTNGKFRVIHPGHSVFLTMCKTKCDILVVALNTDYSMRLLGSDPIFDTNERAFNIASLHVVDYVTVFDEENPYKCIVEVDPDIVFKGTDYKGKEVISANKPVEIIEIPFPIHTSDFIKTKEDRTESKKFFDI